MYDRILYQVKERAGNRGITAENMAKSQHTDFNEHKTNESDSVDGCESWTLRKTEETRLEALEMKGLRKILRVSRTSKNKQVLSSS